MPDCPECTQPFATPTGLGAHRWYKHGVRGVSTASKSSYRRRHGIAAAVETRSAQLRRLLQAPSTDIVGRVARFVVAEPPAGDAWVVCGPAFGPRLCSRVMVGVVVQEAHEPCVVFPFSWLAEIRTESAQVPV